MKKKEQKTVKAKVLTPEEENAQLEKSLDTINLDEIEKSELPFDKAVENERKNIFVTYRKARTRNNILMIVTVVIFIASMILLVNENTKSWGPIVGGVAIGVTILGLLVHYILTKNLFPNTTKKYIRFFLTQSDAFVFSYKSMTNKKLYMEKRYAIGDVLADRCYKDVIDTASRNIVEFSFKGKNVQCGELALYSQGAKKRTKNVMFVGKYLSFSNDLHFEDRYIINIKGSTETDKPNDIEDLEVLSEQNRFVIYGKKGANFVKDLGKDFVNNLKSIECHNALLNMNIVLWAGHTSVYMSYDDSIVAIPFDKEINIGSYNQLKKNINDVCEICLG